MLFLHEKIEQMKQQHKDQIDRMEKNSELYGIMYDVMEFFESEEVGCYHYDGWYEQNEVVVCAYIGFNDNVQDELENDVLYGWVFDDVESTKKSSLTEFKYYYRKGKYTVRIDVTNPNCKQVETGKMVPEMKWVCDE